MGCVIDTCVLIGLERGKYDISKLIEDHSDQSFFLSVISASELLHGVHRAKSTSIINRRSAFVEEILSQFPILEIDLITARLHSRIWADLLSNGNMIGGHDLWIAASCLAHDHQLISDNIAEFSQVPGLKLLAVK
jgi:tRNA(fMet)-specific endonuclease VapC